jgi:gliding motility-associated protein GldM
MAGVKETPRQKMIGMMYLVLTAMLALNVSVEVLQAFVIVNESVEQTNTTIETRINEAYTQFHNQSVINPQKVGPHLEKAMLVKKYSDDLINYIDSIKYTVIALSERKTIDEIKNIPLGEIGSRDGYDVPTNFFIGQEGERREAAILKDKINAYKDNLLQFLPEERRSTFELGLTTDNGYKDADGNAQSWEIHHFFHTILAADVTFLNKLKMDVHNAEYDMVHYLYMGIDEETFKFDKIDVKLIPKSNYVNVDDVYEAEVLVVAYDTTQTPVVKYVMGVDDINGSNIKNATVVEAKDEAGSVKLRIPARSEGINRFAGLIEVKSPNGDLNTYKFSDQFIVDRPSMTVSATKMNVLYRNTHNPISISVPRYSNQQLIPEVSAGNLTKSADGSWDFYIEDTKVDKVTITVSAKTDAGVAKIGVTDYRIKNTPKPIAIIGEFVGNSTDNKISKNFLKQFGQVDITRLDFEFEVITNVTGFTMTISGKGRGNDRYENTYSSNSKYFTDDMKKAIDGSETGYSVEITNVRAKTGNKEEKIDQGVKVYIK